MNFRERKQRLDYLLEMVEKGQCISLMQIAEKFNCSESTVKRMITELRDEGYNIKYCKLNRKFLIKLQEVKN